MNVLIKNGWWIDILLYVIEISVYENALLIGGSYDLEDMMLLLITLCLLCIVFSLEIMVIQYKIIFNKLNDDTIIGTMFRNNKNRTVPATSPSHY